jgi:hypothetical protein
MSGQRILSHRRSFRHDDIIAPDWAPALRVVGHHKHDPTVATGEIAASVNRRAERLRLADHQLEPAILNCGIDAAEPHIRSP